MTAPRLTGTSSRRYDACASDSRRSASAWAATSSACSSRSRACSAATRVSRAMMRLTPTRLMPSSWESRCTSRSRSTSRSEYRRPRPAERPGVTRPSRAYCRSVCGCMPASPAATEMTKTGASGCELSPRSNRSAMAAHQLGQVCPRVLRRCGRERTQRVLRLGGKLLRYGDFDRDQQVTGGAVPARNAPSADPQRAAAGRPRRDLDGHRLFQRRHGDRRAECGLCEGDGHREQQVVPVAREHPMRRYVDDDVQVAGRRAALARRSLARDPDALAVVHPGRDPNGDRALGGRLSAALAGGAGVVDQQPAAAALPAWLGEAEATLVAANHPRTCAVRADPRHGARPGTGARAGCAGVRAGQPQWDGHAGGGLVEVQRHLGLDVGAPRRGPGVATSAAAEEPAEDVAEPAEAAAAEQRARLVVLLAPLLVRQDVVGLGDLLEPFLGLGLALVRVRVVLASQLPICFLDVRRLSVLGYANCLVVVLFDEVFSTHDFAITGVPPFASAGRRMSFSVLLSVLRPLMRARPRPGLPWSQPVLATAHRPPSWAQPARPASWARPARPAPWARPARPAPPRPPTPAAGCDRSPGSPAA